ncbi:MAG: hypothetical protein KAU62_00380 [Candidatus Heimdallarchaeota archaeon]|nr:hypothetical protein [Candidatus Heimdallarchaeota archaeon]MCK4609587.1 hypothetical protein [Candidatus Heimdallarchaeota archaeon]
MNNALEIKKKTEMKYNWRILITWGFLGLIFVLIVIMTFMRTPEHIINTLTLISSQLKYYFLAMHIVMILLLGTGIVWTRFRNQIFFVMLFLLSLSSTVVSSIFVVIPNIIFFGVITGLVFLAFVSKKLKFDLENAKILDWIFSSIGLLFGFWYLHWIDAPIALNALLYSPLGGVNCPTLVMMTALLILTKKPKPIMLSTFVGVLTIYFGFFGIIMIGAYVDIVLILCGMYLVGKNLFNWITIRKEKTTEKS